MRRISPPLSGDWPWATPPPVVLLVDDPDVGLEPFVVLGFVEGYVEPRHHVLRRARLQERRGGIVAQYREARDRDSRHLHVVPKARCGCGGEHPGLQWRIDHTDDYNPDAGHVLRHFVADHPMGQLLLGFRSATARRAR